MKSLAFFVMLIFIVVSCTPAPEIVERAYGETQTAIALLTPSSTNTPEMTNTPTITNTPKPTETPEPTITPTPDLRIIDVDPSILLLKQSDLPRESQYYLPYTDSTGRTSVNEQIGMWGNDLISAQLFMEETERIDSWYVNFYRGSARLTAPESLGCSVAKHKSNEGVIIYIEKYNFVQKPFRDEAPWILDQTGIPELGEHSIGISTEYFDEYSRKVYGYRVEAPYNNYYIACWGYGSFKEEATSEYVANLVMIIIDKIKQYPLVTPMP